MTEPIKWTVTRERFPLLGRCRDVVVAVVGGLCLLAIVGLLVGFGLQVRRGNWDLLLLALLLALIGGPGSLLYLWPMLTDADQRPDRTRFPLRSQSLRRTAALALIGSVSLVGTAIVWPLAAVLSVLGAVFVLLPLLGLVRTEGRLDPEAGTITVDGQTGALDALTDSRQVTLGSLTVLWLTYASGTSLWTAPRLVVLPTSVAQQVRTHVTAGITTPMPTDDDDRRDSNRTVQATLVTFALLFLGVAVAQFLVADLPTAIALWASSLMALFALVFLWLAVREGN